MLLPVFTLALLARGGTATAGDRCDPPVFSPYGHLTLRTVTSFQAHDPWVRSLAFHPSGRWVATGGEDGTVRIWDVRTGRLLQTVRGHTKPVYALAWNAAGTMLASGGFDGRIALFRAEAVAPLPGPAA